jgi:hypothetical protein
MAAGVSPNWDFTEVVGHFNRFKLGTFSQTTARALILIKDFRTLENKLIHASRSQSGPRPRPHPAAAR